MVGIIVRRFMKNDFLKYIPILCLGPLASATLGHDIPVHQAITINAQQSAYNTSSGYTQFVNVVSSDIQFIDATNYLVKGSGFEDNKDVPGDFGGKRSLNHKQIGTLAPICVNDDRAGYYFTSTSIINGQAIGFPVEFDKENGVWKILEF